MTEEQAREILLKQFDKSCGNYTYQNAHKIDLEEALFMGAKALEKQIPKKPVNYDRVPHSKCPTCNCAVKIFNSEHEYNCCQNCGQAIDWSEEE